MRDQCQGYQPDLIVHHPPEVATTTAVWRCYKERSHTITFARPLTWHGASRTRWELCDDCGRRFVRDLKLSMTDPAKPLEIANAAQVD